MLQNIITKIKSSFNTRSQRTTTVSEEYEENETGGAVHKLYQAKTLRCAICGVHVATGDSFAYPTATSGIAPSVESVIRTGGKLFCPEHKGMSSKVCVHSIYLKNSCQYCPEDEQVTNLGQLRRRDDNHL